MRTIIIAGFVGFAIGCIAEMMLVVLVAHLARKRQHDEEDDYESRNRRIIQAYRQREKDATSELERLYKRNAEDVS